MHIPRKPKPDSVELTLPAVIERLSREARRCGQRRAVQLAGASEWCIQAAVTALDRVQPQVAHWFSTQAPAGAASSHGGEALRLLGTELDVLVFDAWSGFDPDAFGALTGTLRAGGLLLLLTPPFDAWPEFADPQNARITVEPFPPESLSARFVKRLVRVLKASPDVVRVEQGKAIDFAESGAECELPRCEMVEPPYRTDDQKRAVEAVMRVATGHRRRPVVLTADRGRGKSAAFGIAAAHLIQRGRERILVTGPALESVQAVLDHARALLSEEQHPAIRFVAPDVLVRDPQPADLLLVDEAAALPTPLLSSLLKSYARIAFATTVHGYEGTGRGFALRFTRILDRFSNSWKSIQLTTPVRWAPGDPLERLAFRMLLLDANATPEACFGTVNDERVAIQRIDRDQLCEDDASLDELFGLLVLAHYRTRPLDLRHLLDGPNLSIYVLRVGEHIAATALLADEGGFGKARSEAICRGLSRPRGHLLPETLAAHQGLCEALGLKGARVIRIAVHPSLQGRGLGTRLLQHIATQCDGQGYDYLGSSFGATPELLRFWQHVGAAPVRLGFQRGAASGCHSAVVLRPLSSTGELLFNNARERFFVNLPHQLADSLRDIETELVVALFEHAGVHGIELSEADWRDAQGFAFDRRLLESAVGAVWRLACFALMERRGICQLDREEMKVLVTRVLQMHSWQSCAQLLGVSGHAQAQALLRRAVARLIGYYRSGI